jgi:hypothetical protein
LAEVPYNTHIDTKELNMAEVEYAKWVLADTGRYMIQAVVIYGVALGAYWMMVA